MKKNKILFILSILLPLAASLLYISGFGRTAEYRTLDWRFRVRGPRPASKNIFIAAMDDPSVDALGRWPWRRLAIASFMQMLKAAPPAELVLDILYTEPSSDFPADDRIMSGQAEGLGRVYFPFYCLYEAADIGANSVSELEPSGAAVIDKISLGKVSDYPGADFIDAGSVMMPIEGFARITRGSGYVNSEPDADGVNRRIPLVMQYDGYIIPNVAFDSALNFLKADRESVKIRPGRHISFKTPERVVRIPVDKKMRMIVNHAGVFSPATIPMRSFVGLIRDYSALASGEDPFRDMEQIQNSIMFVGLTATGTSDHGVTPFSSVFPMVGYLATASSNIIEGDFIRAVPAWVNLILIFLTGFIAALLTSKRRAVSAALLNGLLVTAYAAIAVILFYQNIVIVLAYPAASVFLTYAGITIYRFTGEEKEKKAIKCMFSRYVSSQIVDELMKNPETVTLGGSRKRLTVFFSDIRGFTSMSEQLSPEDVVHVLNEYLTAMIDIVFKYNGTLDKFMGDAVMAIWGAPVPQPDHAELAVKAAWEMLRKLESLQEKWIAEGRKPISVGMGLNTGDVIIGNMGSLQFSDYTVIGDNVNLAARLEQNAGPGQLIISEATYEEVKDIVEVRRLEPMKVKGKEKLINVYEVIELKK